MERLDTTAPPVVAVMVVHQPDDQLDEVLAGLGAQDYPDIRTLLLVTGGDAELDDVRGRAASHLPGAVVRSLGGNPGFGPACNVALDLVEGDRGFFLTLHDDVALEPSAVRCLVEELYRSNAGIVGPKLVEWDDPRRLHLVGLGVDRIGEIDTLVEPGEFDQEQHDAVRDVFALPSACLLIRADLMRLLRFDDRIDFHGDDVDLCWRAHLTGARVLLVPAARARHRGRLPERRPDLAHRALMARHRAWTVATLTGAGRLPGVMLRLLVITLAELVAGLFTGKARPAWSMWWSTLGLVPRLPGLLARRRQLRPIRKVPEGEVAYLQMRGSARLQRYRRSRQADVARRRHGARRAMEASPDLGGAVVTWAVVLAFVIIGSRRLLLDGVAPVGEMLPLPASAGDTLGVFASAWWGQGLGGGQPAPTGLALVGLTGVALLGQMGLVHTLATVGLLVVGLLGLWRLGAGLGHETARRACLLGGLLVPFASGALASGRWSALALWAATPWWTVGVVEAGSAAARPVRRRALLGMVLSVALVSAFVPAAVTVVLALGVVLGVATVFGHERSTGAGLAAAGRGLLRCVVAVVGAAVLHLPWSWSFVTDQWWDELMGSGVTGSKGVGGWELLQWGRSGAALAALSALVLVAPLSVALLARGGRAVWGLRSACLVGGFGLIAVVVDRDLLPFAGGDVWWWMAPVAVGSALSVGTLVASWKDDVVTRSFGWRQPLGLITAAAVAAAALGPLVGLVDGRWDQPRTALPVLLGQLPTHDDAGDYRTLFVGDARVVPMRSWPLAEGLGYAVVDDGPLTATQHRWLPPASAAVRSVAEAFDAMADDATARLGRLLAPLGIRYIVVPLLDGVVSTPDRPLEPPVGLLDRLGRQLDLRRRSGTAELVIFENSAWIPTRAVLSGAAAEASRQAGLDALVSAPLDDGTPVMVGTEPAQAGNARMTVEPGSVVHLGVPRAAGWQLEVDGTRVASRTSFGTVTAWDLPSGGSVRLDMTPPREPLRWLMIASQGAVWALIGILAAGGRLIPRRRERAHVPGGPVVHLGEPT